MLDLDIQLHWSKSATPDVRRALQMDMAIARASARHIRRRMLGGDTATPRKPYAGPRSTSIDKRTGKPRKRNYTISPAYAAELGLSETRYASSQDFHAAAGVRPGSAHVTGGMWKGLRVRNFGRQAALIEFSGSSLGASSVKTARTVAAKTDAGEVQFEVTQDARGKLKARRVNKVRKNKRGEVQYRKKPKMVRNSEKGGRVFKHTEVAPLMQTRDEALAQLAAVADKTQAIVVLAFGSDVIASSTLRGNRRLFAAIKRELR